MLTPPGRERKREGGEGKTEEEEGKGPKRKGSMVCVGGGKGLARSLEANEVVPGFFLPSFVEVGWIRRCLVKRGPRLLQVFRWRH